FDPKPDRPRIRGHTLLPKQKLTATTFRILKRRGVITGSTAYLTSHYRNQQQRQRDCRAAEAPDNRSRPPSKRRPSPRSGQQNEDHGPEEQQRSDVIHTLHLFFEGDGFEGDREVEVDNRDSEGAEGEAAGEGGRLDRGGRGTRAGSGKG
ncbi:hypothetical protein BDK51DRAFT_32297, partial [Blyttiomyces helicus]